MMRRGLLLVIIIALFLPVKVFSSDYAEYLPKWLNLLKEGNDDEKKVALNSLWGLQYPEYRKDIKVFDPILETLKDKDPSIREAAAACLKGIGEGIQKSVDDKVWSRNCCKNTIIVPSLIKALLEDKNPRVRAEAAKALGMYRSDRRDRYIVDKEERAIDPLIKALKDRNPWVRLNAAYSLGELGAKHGVDALLNLLEDNSDWRNKFVQQECVIALRKIEGRTGINDKKAITVLMKHFNDEYLKADIIKTLGIFRAEEAHDLLMAATKDSNERIRKLALEAISGSSRYPLPTREIDIDAPSEEAIFTKEPQIDIYINSLKDPSADVRVQSIIALGQRWDKRAVDPLIQALDDSSAKVREAAIAALGNFADERILDAIINRKITTDLAKKTFRSVAKKTSKETVYVFRKEGMRYVTKNSKELPKHSHYYELIMNPTAVNKLLAALDSPNADIKLSILNIIWNFFEDSRIEEYLIKLLDDTSIPLRERAASLLSGVGTEKAVPKLLLALNDQNRSVRAEAAKALGQIQDKRALEPLIKLLNDSYDSVKADTLSALGNFNDSRILDINIKMLQDKSIRVKRSALYNIREKPDKRAVEFLIPLLNDLDLSSLAAEALGKCADKRAVDPLIKALKGEFNRNRSFNGDANLRRSAPRALGLIGDKKAVPSLIEVVSNQKEEPYMRSEAAIALGEIGDPSALEALNNLLNDKKFPFPQHVKEAIKKIKSQQGANK